MSSSFDLIGSKGRMRHARQGGALPPQVDDTQSRLGRRSILYRSGNDSTGGSQRTEHAIVHYSNPKPIADGSVWYTGFSLRLDDDYPRPGSWHVLHQIQQSPMTPRGDGNNPILGLYYDRATLTISWKHGTNGHTNPAGGPRNWTAGGHTVDYDGKAIETGRWYDLIVGWKFSPSRDDGWVEVYIKPAEEAVYRLHRVDGIRLGYTDPPSEIFQNKFGIYKEADGQSHRAWFDEVRFSADRNDVAVPGGRFRP